MPDPSRPTGLEGGTDRVLPSRRGHAPVPHTADAGFTAAAPDLPALFQEAATALTEIAADVATGVVASAWLDIALEARDVSELAYEWLNELITLGDIHHAAIVATRLLAVDPPDPAYAPGRWRLCGRVGLRSYSEGGVRPLRQLKSATYHGLVVDHRAGGWTLQAYVDL